MPIHNEAYTLDNLSPSTATLRPSTGTPRRLRQFATTILSCAIRGVHCWHSLSDRWWHYLVNVIGCVCSTLFKDHPAVVRFEEHTVLLSMVMNETSRPSPAVAYQLHYTWPSGCGCNQVRADARPTTMLKQSMTSLTARHVGQPEVLRGPLKYVAVSRPS